MGSYNVVRLKHRWEDTIRNYCEPTGNKCDIVDWIITAQDGLLVAVSVNHEIKLRGRGFVD